MSEEAILRPFFNRLRKNARHWGKWARRTGIECYRLYDRDIPEFPLVVDRYAHRLHVQELAETYSVAPIDRAHWLDILREGAAQAAEVKPHDVVVKARHGQRPTAQYARASDVGNEFAVSEAGLSFLVNLERYLDTGLFLDQRDTRQLIRGCCAGKRVLNLFCYTASFSVYAAAGDAAMSLSVDLSKTYLDWARRNFELNRIDRNRHRLQQADVLQFLRATQVDVPFDLIILDPPSFSNSKRMIEVLDIQRDHAQLIEQCVRWLAPAGKLLFSANLRDFKLDRGVLQRWWAEKLDLVPADFRNRRIHHAWWLTRISQRSGLVRNAG